MAELTPARITYTLGDSEQVIRFHAVDSEAHQATSEVTKFPVQSGFQVSNHAIRHNRKITIVAVISNTLIKGGETSYQYSLSNNSKTVFQMLNDLVNSKIRAQVLTNLGLYTPVIFTSFKTTQKVGMVDSMKITLVGEELQDSSALNGTSPTPVSWSTLSDESALARVEDLRAAGIDISDEAASKSGFLEEASIDLGSDFSIDSVDSLGVASVTTYINKGVDPTTGIYPYEVHTTDLGLFEDPAEILGGSSSAASLLGKISAGVKDATGCIVKGGSTILINEAEDIVDTAMGKLKKSAYGAFYGVMNMSSDTIGQALIGMSAGCVIRGVTGHSDKFPYKPGESLPNAADIINGAVEYGNSLLGSTDVTSSGIITSQTTLTRF